MASPKKVYWDACIWLTLINGESESSARCEYLIEQARKGDISIWTSSLTLAEVFRKKCEDRDASLPETEDLNFENFLEQDFLVEVQLDHDIGTMARRLLRLHPQLKKPTDAIHLATAISHDIDEFHTYDYKNLLCLNGKIDRKDGKLLTICEPSPVPLAPKQPQADLFKAENFIKDEMP